MARILRPSAFFLASGYVVLGIVTLILFAAPIFYAWHVTIDEVLTKLLLKDTQHLLETYKQKGPKNLVQLINTRINLEIAGERVLLLADATKHPLAGNLNVWPSMIPDKAGTYTISMPINGHVTQVVIVKTILPNGYNLIVGRDRSRLIPIENSFWLGLVGAGGVITIIGIMGGIILRRVLMSRIQGIHHTVSAIMQGDLKHRLPTRSTGDELDTLSITINHLLEQIEQLVQGIRHVSNAIAHDLRTPLAELRSRLEELASTQPSPQETFIEIDGAVADVDRVITVFNALLRLAEIDAGTRRSGFTQVDVTNVVAEAVDFYLPAIELKEITLRFHPEAPIYVVGDSTLLTQAIGNLIDNALKYVDHNGHIFVEVKQVDSQIHIIIADSGPGIPDSEKSKVIERFFRGSAASDTSGVGLGLTLVEAVATLHAGRLILKDNHPGLRATLII
jgi:signal transduction histidine kinase